MEAFKPVDTNLYVCYTVRNELWNANRQRYVERKLVIFDNESDANKCINIMDAYARMFFSGVLMRNTITKDMFVFDGATLHLISGSIVGYDEYSRTRQSIHDIERTHPMESWGYMDAYAKLFGYEARRPRSCLPSLLCCVLCCCCFGQDVYSYTLTCSSA
jgi:hypothetical protein